MSDEFDPLYYPPEEDELLPEDEDYWIDNCGQGQGYEGCTKAGSEECDFECPFRDELEQESEMNLKQLEPKVVAWAERSGRIHGASKKEQAIAEATKTIEHLEFLEAADDAQKTMIAAGTVMVSLILQCCIAGQSITFAMSCLEGAPRAEGVSILEQATRIKKAAQGGATAWQYVLIGQLVDDIKVIVRFYDLTLSGCVEEVLKELLKREIESA